MAFNPQEFISDINSTNGVALSSDFRVRITPPDIMIDEGLARNLEFRIDSIEFPGRNVNEINYSLYGPPQKIGGILNYVPVNFSVIMSPDMRERDFFLKWQDLIGGNHRTNSRGKGTPGGSELPAGSVNEDDMKTQFNIGFYKDYISEQGVTIEQLKVMGKDDAAKPIVVYSLTLRECYPTTVSTQAMSWGTSDVAKVNIGMQYRYFVDNLTNTDTTHEHRNSLFSRLNKSGAGGLINMGVGRLAEKAGQKATEAALFAASKLMK